MANEATLMVETEIPIMMTVGNATAIEKGAILALNDPFTVVNSTGDNNVFAGIAAEEKIASDGKTKIAVYTAGLFKMVVGAAGSTMGKNQAIGAATNVIVDSSAADNDLGYIVGKAMETGTVGETILVLVGRY